MKLVTFVADCKEQVGVLSPKEDRIYPIALAGISYATMNELIMRWTKENREALEELVAQGGMKGYARTETTPCSPIPVPMQDVVCLGINYAAHAVESSRYKKTAFDGKVDQAIYFSKRVNRAVADKEPIDSHPGLVQRLDYEAELGVILGKDARKVSKEEAYDYIFGYTVINDVSARVLQTEHKQWYFGKSLDGFTPMGPCITTADEIPGKPELAISSKINGELRQNSNTNLLIHDIAEVISELSQGMTLQAGTIIATGTPEGVGMGMIPPCFLKPGDVVECTIEGIGTITNTVE